MRQNDRAAGSVRLVAVGDVMLGDSAICTGYGFASRYRTPSAEALAGLSDLFGPADIVFGNLECVLSERRHVRRGWASTQLRAHPGFAAALRRAGFSIMNVANNHASQHGHDAFADTVSHLRTAGIACCGLRGADGWTSAPVVLTVNGLRVGFLGYCLRPRQYSPETPPYAEGTPETIRVDIQRLRSDVDHVITSLHWGEEYVSQPSAQEVDLAQTLVDAGCSAILGHHPHVHRPIERHGLGIIAYSLGNFVSDMIWYAPLRRPSMLSLELSDDIRDVAAERMWVADTYLPVRCSPPEPACIHDAVSGLDEETYQAEIARTISEGRTAAYLHALKHLHRFRAPTLLQLLAVTARNKVDSIATMLRRDS